MGGGVSGALVGNGYVLNLVRAYQGLQIFWRLAEVPKHRRFVRAQSWFLPISWPIRAPFHLSERSNLTPPKPGQMTNWRPAFQHTLFTGDPELDARFVLFAPAASELLQALFADPAIRQTLLSSAYVDLEVRPDVATFSDPRGRNTTEAAGGVNDARYPGARLEESIPIHDRVANLLMSAATRVR